MPRSPGPPPKDPSERARRNKDPNLAGDGWVEIDRDPYDGDVPPIPEWVEGVGDQARQVYEYLMRLPQARLYGPGTLFEIWLTLPLIQRYLETSKGSGVETYKGIIAALGPALNLTESDMAKARIKFKELVDESAPAAGSEQAARADELASRRDRIKKKREASTETG